MFEITDFTSASDWERFIGAVTELLHEWKAIDDPPATEAETGAAGVTEGQPATLTVRPVHRRAEVSFAGTFCVVVSLLRQGVFYVYADGPNVLRCELISRVERTSEYPCDAGNVELR